MLFSFPPTEILYIYSIYMYVLRSNFSFCVNNGLEKKMFQRLPIALAQLKAYIFEDL